MMKLDKEDILAALETITVSGEGKNMVESGAVQNVLKTTSSIPFVKKYILMQK